ncbi:MULTISPECIES: type III secretion system effector HopB1 [Pseudomonas syringae group]|uniref:Type III effector HopB1 n=2 Tax=Pseudomonas syringae pv. maculicola TaxID=59511 RepID=A0A3M6BMP0_PSEYM|nr:MULTISPECIES: type III secretion system effector HopB1 [Pseudomonas syringae group]MBM0209297.1 type III secretion system effector HopB1 [Pseudomonas syringae pv. maculicola]RMM16394.1 Type III effector HopB1 [Pseudomonas syringae]RMV32845.1 Type III effector HopB1 [Pseudomonas syringae pv. maculicola]
MRPVGGPAPGYYPPAYEAERPTAQTAGNDRARSSQASSSPAASVATETPMLGDLKRFPAGRYPDMKVENIRLKIEGQELGGKEGVKHTRRRKPDAAGSSHVHGGQSVASTLASAQSKALQDTNFKASDLAELARWCESPHPYALAPSKAAGKSSQLSANVVSILLQEGKHALEQRLEAQGLKLGDVVVSEGRDHLHINLNYLEMDSCLGTSKGLWAPDSNDKKLIAKAARYFDDFNAQKLPELAPLTKMKSKDSLGVMRELLRDAPGLVIGEGHNSTSSKRELINNMKSLKASGVTTLFMEHLCAESHDKALNNYLSAPKGSPMPARLKNYLDLQSQGHQAPEELHTKYNFTTLVEAAKHAGLRVVSLDTTSTYMAPEKAEIKRAQAMNYYAAEKIRLSKPEGKWVAFVGATHATSCDGVPGLAELHGVRSLVIDDLGLKSRATVDINVKNYGGKLNPDVRLSYKV